MIDQIALGRTNTQERWGAPDRPGFWLKASRGNWKIHKKYGKPIKTKTENHFTVVGGSQNFDFLTFIS